MDLKVDFIFIHQNFNTAILRGGQGALQFQLSSVFILCSVAARRHFVLEATFCVALDLK